MYLNDIANRFVELCRSRQSVVAIQELYADDARSIEACEMPTPPDTPAMPREMQGKEALIGKNTWWYENHVVHSMDINGPYPHGDNQFACTWSVDVTNKQMNLRFQMEEIAVFTVADEKIVEERFFYTMDAP